MSAAARRAALWAKARALAAPETGAVALSPRARRLAVSHGRRPVAFADLDTAPAWLAWDRAALAHLARLAGAAGVAGAWRRTVAGEVLGRAADAIGEAALDALLNQAADEPVADAAAAAAHPEALERLGAQALAAELADRPALSERLLERLPDALPLADRRRGARMRRDAEALLLQTGGAA